MAVTTGLSYQEKEQERLRFKEEKFGGINESNMKASPKRKGLTAEEAYEARVAKEREIRPEGWKPSSNSYVHEDATNHELMRQSELRKSHLMRSEVPFMWHQKEGEIQPNIYLRLIPELGIGGDFSGAFTTPVYLQTWLDQHRVEVYKLVLTKLNSMKKLTTEQKELSNKLQELIVSTK